MHDQLFTLFLCPYCDKYTIHMPRLTKEGRWMVDHTLVERMFCNSGMVTVPYSWCEITAVSLTEAHRFTRAVIRV